MLSRPDKAVPDAPDQRVPDGPVLIHAPSPPFDIRVRSVTTVCAGLTDLAGRAEAGAFEGSSLEVLRACDITASTQVFLAQNQVGLDWDKTCGH